MECTHLAQLPTQPIMTSLNNPSEYYQFRNAIDARNFSTFLSETMLGDVSFWDWRKISDAKGVNPFPMLQHMSRLLKSICAESGRSGIFKGVIA